MTRRVLTKTRIATMAGSAPYGLIDWGCLAIEDGTVVWVGEELPAEFSDWPHESLE